MMHLLRKLWKDESGATAVEYGLMTAAIAAVIVAIVFILGGQVNTAFSTVSNQMANP
jgi:pilus assembly protein Flp/PilA